jgi:hypothetical protein
MAQLPSQSQFGDYGEWPGRDVLDSGGERLGGVREIYLDRETGRPEWVLVDVAGDEARFVPLADASVESSRIRVAHSAAAIRSAPGIGSEPRIDQSEERRLYDHYGLGYSETDSGSGLPAEEPAPTAWGSEQPDPWGTDEPRPDPWPAPEESSWSAAADEEKPADLAPAPAEPPAADGETLAATPDAEDLKAQPGPDAVRPTQPPRIHQVPPPVDEPAGGPLEAIAARKTGIAAGVAIAAVLVFAIRRRR